MDLPAGFPRSAWSKALTSIQSFPHTLTSVSRDPPVSHQSPSKVTSLRLTGKANNQGWIKIETCHQKKHELDQQVVDEIMGDLLTYPLTPPAKYHLKCSSSKLPGSSEFIAALVHPPHPFLSCETSISLSFISRVKKNGEGFDSSSRCFFSKRMPKGWLIYQHPLPIRAHTLQLVVFLGWYIPSLKTKSKFRPWKNWWFGRWISFWEKFTIQLARSVFETTYHRNGQNHRVFYGLHLKGGGIKAVQLVGKTGEQPINWIWLFPLPHNPKNALLERTSKQSQTHHQESEKNEYIEFRLYIYT